MIRAIHWSPEPSQAPAFQHYRADETTVRAMTLTQVELHKQRNAYNTLADNATRNEAEWAKLRGEMEDKMKQLQIQNSEAERIFQRQLLQLKDALKAAESHLEQLGAEHDALKTNSESHINNLQHRSDALQAMCNDLEKRRAKLQEALGQAALNEKLRQEAEKRVSELEDAIKRVRDRSKQIIQHLQRQRDEAQHGCKTLQGQLNETSAALRQQAALRQKNEERAIGLGIEARKLSAALEVERLINEPLRNTNHEASTLSHVMRSDAAPYVTDRSKTPLGRIVPFLQARQPPYPSAHSSPAAQLSRWGGGQGTSLAVQPSIAAPLGSINHHLNERSLMGRDATRLSRSWATTTGTAGLKHPVFEDNYELHKHRYMAGARGSSASRVRGALSYADDQSGLYGGPATGEVAGGVGCIPAARGPQLYHGVPSAAAFIGLSPPSAAEGGKFTPSVTWNATVSAGAEGQTYDHGSGDGAGARPASAPHCITPLGAVSTAEGESRRVSLSAAAAAAAAVAVVSRGEATLTASIRGQGDPYQAHGGSSSGQFLSSILTPVKRAEAATRKPAVPPRSAPHSRTKGSGPFSPGTPSTGRRSGVSSSYRTISYSPSREMAFLQHH